MKRYKNTDYKKVKTGDTKRVLNSKFKAGEKYTVWSTGKSHLMFKTRGTRHDPGVWKFICGKRLPGIFDRINFDDVPDDYPITCLNCIKHGPEVIEVMKGVEEDIPNLDEFQDDWSGDEETTDSASDDDDSSMLKLVDDDGHDLPYDFDNILNIDDHRDDRGSSNRHPSSGTDHDYD